ncbi:uncharacterized protein PV06_08029 [Exophiala oligosperma]|uniref:Uncharacterized protein n=1 Tax=Exophiala oligosperma TaxID=215243 RepID=A0A0D2DEG3_9EURO|nr:uncharacterized protein PV06_08029 [Exophiala oligosperma]KIW40860.1 hypothetical protein PV06_08029 [Exophiala oligosperma]
MTIRPRLQQLCGTWSREAGEVEERDESGSAEGEPEEAPPSVPFAHGTSNDGANKGSEESGRAIEKPTQIPRSCKKNKSATTCTAIVSLGDAPNSTSTLAPKKLP